MPVPLNAFTEVIRCWLTKRLGYLVDDSIPVNWHKNPVPSDIDIVAAHPTKKEIVVEFLKRKLKSNLLVESKGWFDSQSGISIISCLDYDRKLLKTNDGVIPKECTKKKDEFTFGILKEEVFEEGKKIFGSQDFDRVIIVPKLPRKNARREGLIKELLENSIIIIEISDIFEDLFKYIKEPESKDHLRKNFVLEFLHLIEVCKK